MPSSKGPTDNRRAAAREAMTTTPEARYREVIERARRTNVPAARLARRMVEEDDARLDAETVKRQREAAQHIYDIDHMSEDDD